MAKRLKSGRKGSGSTYCGNTTDDRSGAERIYEETIKEVLSNRKEALDRLAEYIRKAVQSKKKVATIVATLTNEVPMALTSLDIYVDGDDVHVEHAIRLIDERVEELLRLSNLKRPDRQALDREMMRIVEIIEAQRRRYDEAPTPGDWI